MKNINKKILTVAALILSSTLILVSCKNKNKENNIEETEQEEVQQVKVRPQWTNSAEKICIVFGYGYNSEEFITEETERLAKNFGLSDGTEDSGMIIPYVFPEDLKVGNTGRISRLITLLEDVKLKGLITVGAPEYTCNTLAALREKMEEGKEYPIYTFFPQDEILAIEATSDFILDKAVEQSDKIEEVKEEVEQTHIFGIEDIIDNAVDYIIAHPSPLKSNSELQMHVNNIAGSSYKTKRYIDPETGLSSINHFIIEENN